MNLLAEITRITGSFGALSDDALAAAVRSLEEVGRAIDTARAVGAAEVARRSDPALGYAGLAVREGHRTPQHMIAVLTGSSRASAARRVRVGEAIASLSIGGLPLDQADVVARALGDLPDSPARGAAVDQLLSTAKTVDADTLAIHARAVRLALEAPSALEAEALLRHQRYLRIGPEIDGLRRLSGLLDPESAAVLVAAFDAATSPRRGGPRFIDPEARRAAAELAADERTDDQLRLDVLVDLVRVASAVGDKPVLGAARPAVRVVIAARDLTGDGWASLEGAIAPVSAATARRIACDSGVLPVVLGTDSEVLDLGRTARVFSPAQRTALAVRDGGCRWPGCDRPPSWTEAHHLLEWSRGGATSIENGVLLCRHHHLLVHNNGWRIERTDGGLAVKPPSDIDLLQRHRPLPVKSVVASRLATVSR